MECLVLTIGYSGGITKGLLNEYFFRDVRWVGKDVIITINQVVKYRIVGRTKDCFIAFFGFLADHFTKSVDCFFSTCP